MKFAKLLVKLAIAAAAVVGVAYLIVRYMDSIKAWAEKLCPLNADVEILEDKAPVKAAPVEEVPVEEPVEEVIAEEPAEEAPAEEVPADDSVPVADAADFEA